jgi:hypothetical protein
MMTIQHRLSQYLGLGAAVWSVLMSLYLAVIPTGQGVTTTILADGAQIQREFTTYLLERNPVSGSIALSVAALLGLSGGWAAWTGRRKVLWSAAGLFFLGTLVAGFSIGPAYLPAAGALLLAAVLSILVR